MSVELMRQGNAAEEIAIAAADEASNRHDVDI